MKVKKILSLVLAGAMAFSIGCSGGGDKVKEEGKGESGGDKKIVVGYAQLGAESEWRTACTNSVKEEASKRGIELKFSDAQQKQENQIKAIRSFIAQKVDVIGVSPVVESGWETVFKEVKDAGIPLVLVDRKADVPEDLYTCYLGSDFVEEGKKAADELAKLISNW